MADKADQALKLAQKVEKDLVRIEKNLCDQINEGFKKIRDMPTNKKKGSRNFTSSKPTR